MNNYTIYRIRDKTTGETYIGSTKNTLEWRIKIHIRDKDCKSWKILKNNNYTTKSLLKMYCNKKTALWLERFAMDNHYKVVNSYRSIQTKEEYLKGMREYNKEYYKNNKEKKIEYNKKKRANQQSISCPCGGHYKPHMKSRHMKSKKHQRWENNE
jgi:hypothetical protein